MMTTLKSLEIFSAFSEAMLEALALYVKIETFEEGDTIFKEGDAGTAMYVVEKGQVEIRKKDKTLSFFTKGSIFGEMALFENAQRSADAVARTDLTLYRLDNQDFRKFIFDYPKAGVRFLYTSINEMSRRLRLTSEYLTTVFETGRIVGGNDSLYDMTRKILDRLLSDINGSTGGLILIFNPFTEMYDVACQANLMALDLAGALKIIEKHADENPIHTLDEVTVLSVAIREAENILGFIMLEKTSESGPFSTQDEIIVSAVGCQVGLGIMKAYHKQEEEARRRLQRKKMLRF
ncbi:MAG: cyclic nucleotide-binding domain-containing protein [Deltaproteobacteria bacterium]|jgi:CRP-like cAMP-binding protein|nr:cyclic nucleotide-binding domain-containing protein [Deltaproteobacteria bacterium]